MRALIVIRLSRVTDATTSPERQLEACQKLCAERGYEVAGIAEDLDVSGAVDPFDRKKRPNLAAWLAGEREDFDAVVAYRVDRLTRSIRYLQSLVRWAEDHGKLVISATEPHFDMTSPWSAVLIALLGTVAEMELEGIRERNASAFRHNFKAGKYRGGIPPWGYLPEQDQNGEWRLVQDPEQVKVINEVAARVLDGEPLRAIAHDLTSRGVLTPKDRFAQHQGREVKGYEWHSGPLKRSLTSKTLLGYAVTREVVADARGKAVRTASGKKQFGAETVVRNDDGSPIVRAAPVLSREVFDRLAVELAGRENRKEPTKRSSGLLLQIVHCGVCGRPAYRLKGGPGRKPRYRCASAQYRETCGNRSIPLEHADETVETLILGMLGTSERLERVWDSGSDHSAELAEINDTLADLTSLLGTGSYKAGTPQRLKLNERIQALAARQAELSAETVKPSGWRWQPTGEKFADWWDRQDVSARNVWLRSMGIRLDFEYKPDDPSPDLRLDLGDLGTLTQQMEAGGPAAQWREAFETMAESGVAGLELTADGVTVHGVDGWQHSFALPSDGPVAEQLASE
ncbi:recombinase family protein [Mycolicibacterium vaccae]|uniref:recombinase family protein n=1 Tax=Mycolicibacterium vaccae TaxID=1810 RepID=UPI003D01CABF